MVTLKLYFRFILRTSCKRELNFVTFDLHPFVNLPRFISFFVTFTPENHLTNSAILWNGSISVRPKRSSGMNVNVI